MSRYLTIIVAVALSFLCKSTEASTKYVDNCGHDTACNGTTTACYNGGAGAPNCAKKTIQAGIFAAANLDTVLVAPSATAYTGSSNKNLFWSGKSITVQCNPSCQPPNCTCTIDCQNNARAFNLTSAGGGTIDRFTIKNGSAMGLGGGISVSVAAVTISNNLIDSCTATVGGGGIYLNGATGITQTVSGNTISNNSATGTTGKGGGAYVQGPGTATITSNTFTNNVAGTASGAGGGGLYLIIDAYGNPSVTSNTFDGLDDATHNSGYEGGAILVVGPAGNRGLINHNTIRNCFAATLGGGISINALVSPTVSENTLTNCQATAAGNGNGGGIHCAGGTLAVFRKNNITGCFANFGGGVNITNSSPTFEGNVVDSCQAGWNGGGIRMMPTGTATIIGTTISNNSAPNGAGGGIYSDKHAVVVIRNCKIRNNSAPNGGGIHMSDSEVSGSDLTCNTATTGKGGGLFIEDKSPKIRDSWFVGNAASQGGGIYDIGDSQSPLSRPIISRCIIADNSAGSWGGGILADAYCSPVIVNCKILRNTAGNQGGGLYSYFGTDLSILNSLVSRNSVTTGPGGGASVNSHHGTLNVINSTIADNSATSSPGGLYLGANNLLISNSIVWGNTGGTTGRQINVSNVTATVKRSDIQDGTSATGVLHTGPAWNYDTLTNIQIDPTFIDSDGPANDVTQWQSFNYRVLTGSQVIDRGDNDDLPLDVADIDDNGDTNERIPRDLDAFITSVRRMDDPATADAGAPASGPNANTYTDMGAYEFPVGSGQCPTGTITSAIPPSGTVDARVPFAPNTPFPTWGIGYPLTGLQTDPDRIRITLQNAGVPVSGADKLTCWTLCETGVSTASANKITTVLSMGSGQYEISLNRAITTNGVATIRYEPSGSFVEYTAHPGNVNADSLTNPADILRLIDSLNGLPPALPIYQCDIDHSGVCMPPDIIAEIDLLNGANGWAVWNAVAKPTNAYCANGMFAAACPSGGGSGGGGGGYCASADCGGDIEPMSASTLGGEGGEQVLSDDTVAGQDNANVANWIVTYLIETNPNDSQSEELLDVVVDSMTQWVAEHFSADEKANLLQHLADPELIFASEAGEEGAMTLAQGLD